MTQPGSSLQTTFNDKEFKIFSTDLNTGNREIHSYFSGQSDVRQPVHVVYGGAHLYKSDINDKFSRMSLRMLDEYASSPQALAAAIRFEGNPEIMDKVYQRVRNKLEREALEDFRIDFEDGYGHRGDEAEDSCAVSAAEQVAAGMEQGTLPPFIGIRIKSLGSETWGRGLRTLDLFVTRLCSLTAGKLPDGFVVTLPKITHRSHVSVLVSAFEILENKIGLAEGALKMEFMVEATQSLWGTNGTLVLPQLVAVAKERCVAAHFGTYDYTASVGVTASHQKMDHAACDFAKHIMQVSFAGTSVFLSDGATTVMPIGPHKGSAAKALSSAQQQDNKDVIHRSWALSAANIRHSLAGGFYQGWDLHPGQLIPRYATVYAFFLEGLEDASVRLKNFMDQAAKASTVADVFDDAATGQGLLNYFLRSLNCGAIAEDEVLATGLSIEEIRTRSFMKILEGRLTSS